MQLIFRLTPLTSAAKSNEKLVNQKLCNIVLILDALYLIFPFQKSYWFPSQGKENQVSPMTNESEMQNSTKEFFEAEPTDLPAGIMVNGLRKQFKGLSGTNVLAVDSVSFKVKLVNM